MAVKILDTYLEGITVDLMAHTNSLEDFGFKHKIWVYSGRRGIHCWVADERARKLSNVSRKAIVSFIDIKRGGSEVKRKITLPPILHPSLKRSMDVVEAYFPDVMLNDQDFLNSPTSLQNFLNLLPDRTNSFVLT